DPADDVARPDGAEDAGVAGLRPVVPEQEVGVGRNPPRARELVVSVADVGLLELPAVDRDRAAPLADGLARQSDHAFHERPARAAALPGRRRSPKGDDVAAAPAAELQDAE